VLWLVFAFANPYSDQGIGVDTYAVTGMMLMLAALAGWSAWKRWPLGLVIAFTLSIFPVGLYLWGTPGVFRWIAAANVGYLVAAVILWIGRSQRVAV
jgi:hypothetical protein